MRYKKYRAAGWKSIIQMGVRFKKTQGSLNTEQQGVRHKKTQSSWV
jgi:hypothetical protein